MAFANLFGMGGAPLCSIERGRGNNKKAEQTQETPKMAFINSAFGFGFSDNNTNSGASAAFQA